MKRLIVRLVVVAIAATFSGQAFAQAPAMPASPAMPGKGEMKDSQTKDSMKGRMKEEMKTDTMMKPEQPDPMGMKDTMGMKKSDEMMEKKKP
jgi:hypothetical protein